VIPPLKGEGGWPQASRVGLSIMANPRARHLRKSMTPQEVKLWVHLRTWKPRGFHFRRQAPRDGYILDFVCLRNRVIVEVDGGQHNDRSHVMSDKARDAYFAEKGFRILRFWNNEIDENLEGALQTIAGQAQFPHPVGFADHPPPAGEG
jgi:very-short-patch-repair endonuclease